MPGYSYRASIPPERAAAALASLAAPVLALDLMGAYTQASLTPFNGIDRRDHGLERTGRGQQLYTFISFDFHSFFTPGSAGILCIGRVHRRRRDTWRFMRSGAALSLRPIFAVYFFVDASARSRASRAACFASSSASFFWVFSSSRSVVSSFICMLTRSCFAA